jgi:hypothetical protein
MCSVLCLVGTSSGFATCLIDGALTQAHIKGMVRESMMLRKQLGHHSSTAVMFINHQGYSYVGGLARGVPGLAAARTARGRALYGSLLSMALYSCTTTFCRDCLGRVHSGATAACRHVQQHVSLR